MGSIGAVQINKDAAEWNPVMISVAGLLKVHAAGGVPSGATIVCTVTGHGLKDPDWALKGVDGQSITPTRIPVDVYSAAVALGLEG